MEPVKKTKRAKLTQEEKFVVYDLAKEGHNSSKILQVLNIKNGNKTKLKEKIIEIMRIANKNKNESNSKNPLVDFVIGNLPEHQKELFQALKDNMSNANGKIGSVEAIEFMLQGQAKVVLQKFFLQALVDSCFNENVAKKMINLSNTELSIWKKDPVFQKMLSSLQLYKKNFFESKLIKLVDMGDSAATIFANKTFNRGMGYGDRVDVKHTHEHKHLNIDTLNISLKAKKELLAAIQKKNEVPALKAAPDDVIEGEIENVSNG